MASMTRAQAIAALNQGVGQDLDATKLILDLLERQFQAALRHQTAELTTLAEALTPALEAMDARRRQRVALVRALHGATATMATFIASQSAPAQAQISASWQALERLVIDCKNATTRNSSLMAEQFVTMQRVLHGEEGTYAPR